MTQFHSDEYVDFLSRITPSNMNSFVKEQHKCFFISGLSS
jgi:histone deacetylase 1/2